MKNLDFKIAGISVDVDKLFTSGVTILWKLLISTLVFYLVSHFGRKIIKRYLDKHNDKLVLSKRSQTISALVNSLFHYTMVFFYVYSILTILGIPVGTLIASAGIFSLAIGLGAQGFMSDLVNGFFILSEGQYDVGDNVEIGTEAGTVTQLVQDTRRNLFFPRLFACRKLFLNRCCSWVVIGNKQLLLFSKLPFFFWLLEFRQNFWTN
jgi:moderate conductance mechanosensitive channel